MTYRIEIDADTLAELAGKVLALAVQLKGDVGNATPKSAPIAEATESQPTTPEPASTPAPAASASEPLDFDRDVAPAVLALVAAKGKPAVQDILSQYGVERASQVDDSLWPELVATLRAAV